MEQVNYTRAEPRIRQEGERLAGREVELLEAFRRLSDADQARLLLLARSLNWAAGPELSRS
ncbi:hypothetical protein [uncultured Pseudomonas sp.]|uniref:hypothetical protein n=1 Tax=uncultured Pseudomonas sp. TaxID=114707 RepID=UPI0025D855C7|nr:hypothetical protein [uncultured Pseudomonas sp.]